MAKQLANGTLISISNEDTATAYGTATFDLIGGVTDFNPNGSARPIVDITDISDSHRKYKVGIKDSVEVSINVLYDSSDAGQSELLAAYNSGEERYFKVVLPDGEETYVSVLVSGDGDQSNAIDGAITKTWTLKPTTPVTVV